ncbi:MAG: terpene cyclase/mutase family protein, partial [Candidatus Saccharimonas sp.]|nr:terpene cyclase/mutase family protein [Planctomycetaceae bacterium]
MNFGELLRAVIPTPGEFKENVANWVKANAKFWGVSFGMHVAILVILGVAIGAPHAGKLLEEVIYIDSEVDTADEQAAIEHFEVGETPVEPTVLNTDSLTEPPATIEQDAQYNDSSAVFEEAGGGMANGTSAVGGLGVSLASLGDGPALMGAAGLEVGKGDGNKGGSGGAGEGFGGRGTGSREKMVASGGGTADTERAVGGAVSWLARHQNADGSWGCGLQGFARHCKDPSCIKFLKDKDPKEAPAEYTMAATAFGLLPYFAAGQTHETAGVYKPVINRGLTWMTRNQNQKTGQLGTGSMYEHGLATIALCEAYGLSKDRRLQPHAQAAVAFIEDAQNDKSGGWHYTANPATDGDTSVVGWQLMALKSGEMAGLRVNPQTLIKAKAYLKTVAKGKSGGLFAYTAESGPTPTMSAVGLLCNQ